jgi:hypothetical protein
MENRQDVTQWGLLFQAVPSQHLPFPGAVGLNIRPGPLSNTMARESWSKTGFYAVPKKLTNAKKASSFIPEDPVVHDFTFPFEVNHYST